MTKTKAQKRRINAIRNMGYIPIANGPKKPKRFQPRPQKLIKRNQPRRGNRRRGRPFAEMGAKIGGFIGLPSVGRAIGGGIGRIFGSGDYVVTQPSAIKSNTLAGSSPPEFGNQTGSTRIRHREYVRDIDSTVLFALQSFPINPGMSNLFPWLANVAKNYELYRIHGLVIEFKSTSAWAVASTNTSLGVVGCVTQYDASDADFTTKQQAENYQGVQNTSPAHSILHCVECARGTNVLDRLYVRTTALNADQDIKLYDMGKFSIFTVGSQATATIGELWVSYDIELSRPKLPDSTSYAETTMEYYTALNISGNFGWFGSGGGNTFPVRPRFGTYYDKSANRMYFPAKQFPKGVYLCVFNWTRTSGTAGLATQPTFTSTGCSAVQCWSGNSVVSVKAGPSSTDGDMMYAFVLSFSDYYVNGIITDPYISCAGANFGTDIYNLDAYIVPLNSNWNTAPTGVATLDANYNHLLEMVKALQQRLSTVLAIQELPTEEEKEEMISLE